MAENSGSSNELSIDKRISKAEAKIKKFFKALDEEKKKFIAEPVHQLAVTQIILERLSDEINNGDVVELFEQGSQKMRRENPALKSYNATIKSYTALFKQLFELLPGEDAVMAGNEIMNFLTHPAAKK